MSSGFAPVITNIIKLEGLMDIVPDEMREVKAAMDKYGTDFDSVARAIHMWDDYQGKEEIDAALGALVKAFEQKTTVGCCHLELSLAYHDSGRDGDCYDEVSGHFWEVDGVYQYTPSAEKFKGYLERVGYVVMG